MSFPTLQLFIKNHAGEWVDVTPKVGDLDVVMKWGREVEELSFSLDMAGTETDIATFQSGREVQLKVDGVTKFAGIITDYKPSVKLNSRRVACVATSYLSLLESVEVTKKYPPTDVSKVIKDIASAVSGITTDGVETTSITLAPEFKHTSGLKACLDMAEKAGCVLRMTPQKDLQLKPRGFGNNLLANPSFENETAWSLVQYSGTPSVSFDPWGARSGEKCVRVEGNSSADEGGAQQIIDVEAGKRYRFSMFAKGTNAGKLVVIWLDSNYSEISSIVETKALSSNYQEIVLDAVAPSNAAKAKVSARGSGQGVARIDDVYAIKVHELIDTKNVIEASKEEQDYLRRNKVTVVGGWYGGEQIMAVAEEPPGDKPLTIYDFSITNQADAEKLARQKLEQLKVTPVKLEILVDGDADIEPGDYAYVKIDWLDVNGYYVIESVEHSFGKRIFKSKLNLVNPEFIVKEYLENLSESIKKLERPEKLGESQLLMQNIRTIRLDNRPPIVIQNATNVEHDEDGYVVLAGGATVGSFEVSCYPSAQLFRRWKRLVIDYDVGEGDVVMKLLRADGSVAEEISPESLGAWEFPYFPEVRGGLTEQNADEWLAVNGDLGYWDNGRHSVRVTSTTTPFGMIYPKTKDLALDLSGYLLCQFWLYVDEQALVKIRLHMDDANYLERPFVAEGGWALYSFLLRGFDAIGSPSLASINYIALLFESPATQAAIDIEYLFMRYVQEQLKLKFELSRVDTMKKSPKIKMVRWVWEVGG
ncbi:MAG: carbohydrate binding domain-containing protein [Nitrososphaerota archaeon]